MSSVNKFLVGDRPVGQGQPCLVIGEVAQTHDGSLGLAHAFIDSIADAGADAVKFQTHIAAHESTPQEPWRVKFSYQDDTRYEYWERMQFTEQQWSGLRRHALDRNLVFLSSPFSLEAIDLLARIGVDAWKVASGEVSNIPMLERMVETRLPMLLSSGMSSVSELDAAVELSRSQGSPLAVLQCTSMYPCPAEKVGLNLISQFRERYGCAIGLSDHTGEIYSGLAASALGIQVLEVHVTLSREMFGPDVPSSITSNELKTLVKGIRFIETMMGNPVDKDTQANEMSPLRDLFNKSVVMTTDLPAGTILLEEHLTVKKPGTGIPVGKLNYVIGRRLAHIVSRDQILQFDDLE